VSATIEAPRRRAAGALALAALGVAAAALMLALMLGGRSGGEGAAGALGWTGHPRRLAAPDLPRDRGLSGTVSNESDRTVEIEARSIRVVDARGRPLQSDGIFLGSFVRGIYGASRLDRASDFERRRTGRLARIAPGHSRPLTVAWRVRSGDGPAARIVYDGGSLPVPR